jgi:hypothetical protein
MSFPSGENFTALHGGLCKAVRFIGEVISLRDDKVFALEYQPLQRHHNK